MLKSLFGGKKRKAKSVNEIRTGKSRRAPENRDAASPDLEARIKARKAKNLKMADVKAALAGAGYIARPDISGAIEVAKGLSDDIDKEDRKVAIERALRLKGSARVIDEAMAHPAWRYVAMAIIRGLLEEGASESPVDPKPAKQRSKSGKKAH